jgi:hypothetical protein
MDTTEQHHVKSSKQPVSNDRSSIFSLICGNMFTFVCQEGQRQREREREREREKERT